jgi:hypothetical protein
LKFSIVYPFAFVCLLNVTHHGLYSPVFQNHIHFQLPPASGCQVLCFSTACLGWVFSYILYVLNSHTPHNMNHICNNGVIRLQWSSKIFIDWYFCSACSRFRRTKAYHCVTIFYSIQNNKMLYLCIAWSNRLYQVV